MNFRGLHGIEMDLRRWDRCRAAASRGKCCTSKHWNELTSKMYFCKVRLVQIYMEVGRKDLVFLGLGVRLLQEFGQMDVEERRDMAEIEQTYVS